MSHLYIQQPKLRQGSEIVLEHDHIRIVCCGEDYLIYPDEGTSCVQVLHFLQQLDGERTVPHLQAALSDLTPKQVEEYLEVLDENWLLAEGKESMFVGKSGLHFILELEDMRRKWELEDGESAFTKAMFEGTAPRNAVIGFAFEYYHVTRRAHDCITPTIAKSHGEFRNMFTDFFREEYRHDRLLMRSLTALGYSDADIENSLPLPYTAALSNLLAKWAHTDLLSFMASLFIFEGTELDGNEYMEALEAYQMPDQFAAHQGTHNDINVDGDHGNVTREFFSKIEYVSPEEQQRVIQNIRLLHESSRQHHDNIMAYYGNPEASLPRLLTTLHGEDAGQNASGIQDLIREVEKIAQRKSWSPQYLQATNDLQHGTMSPAHLQAFVEELMQFHQRFIQFDSAVLHKPVHPEVMVALSNHFLSMTRFDLRELSTQERLPLPALEALANLLLILVEIDPQAYLLAMTVLPETVWHVSDWQATLANSSFSADEQHTLQDYLAQLGSLSDVIKRVADRFGPLAAWERSRILNNVYLVLETADLLHEEILSGYRKQDTAQFA
jgi:pyrroloquinoline quinone (PQQ) biosynthesis protein C